MTLFLSVIDLAIVFDRHWLISRSIFLCCKKHQKYIPRVWRGIYSKRIGIGCYPLRKTTKALTVIQNSRVYKVVMMLSILFLNLKIFIHLQCFYKNCVGLIVSNELISSRKALKYLTYWQNHGWNCRQNLKKHLR